MRCLYGEHVEAALGRSRCLGMRTHRRLRVALDRSQADHTRVHHAHVPLKLVLEIEELRQIH